MTDNFAYDPGSGLSTAVSIDRDDVAVGPPIGILSIALGAVAVQAALFLVGEPPAHWVGYFIGSVLVPVVVFWFRRVDLTRQRSGLYRSRSGVSWLPAVVLFLGVGLAVAHAFYLAIHKRLA